MPQEVYEIFKETYLNIKTKVNVVEAHYVQQPNDTITAFVTAEIAGKDRVITYKADGSGRLEAVAKALGNAIEKEFNIVTYQEHALEQGSGSAAVAYVGIACDGKTYWGAGTHKDIIVASIYAMVSAINNMLK